MAQQFFTTGVQNRATIDGTERVPLDLAAGGSAFALASAFLNYVLVNLGASVVYLEALLVGPFNPDEYYFVTLVPGITKMPSTNLAARQGASCRIAPTTDVVLYLVDDQTSYETLGYPNGVIATITFSAGLTTGVVSWLGSFTLAALSQLYLYTSPSTFDTAIQGVNVLLPGDDLG